MRGSGKTLLGRHVLLAYGAGDSIPVRGAFYDMDEVIAHEQVGIGVLPVEHFFHGFPAMVNLPSLKSNLTPSPSFLAKDSATGGHICIPRGTSCG